MSLLMEALRKAEEAKRKIQNQSPDSASNFSPEPENQPEMAPVSVVTESADTGFALEEIEAGVTADYIVDNFLLNAKPGENSESRSPEFTTLPSSGKSGRASVEELQNYLETTPELEETTPVARNAIPPVKVSQTGQQRAAGAVFAAKQKPVKSHTTRNILVVLLVLLIPLGGGIFWYLANSAGSSFVIDPALLNMDISNRSFSDEQMNNQPTAEPLAQNPGPVAEIADQSEVEITETAIAPVSVAPVQQPVAPASEALADTVTAGATPFPAAVSPERLATTFAEQQEASDSETATAAALEADATSNTSAATSPVPVLEVSHSKAANNNNQQLLDAYASFQDGNFAAASTLYERVLEQLPNNRDALLGIAAITLREGNVSRARELYSHLMQLNPKDPLARTGLLQTIQDIDPLQYEQELQRLLQQFPEVAPLSFALGNVYASQQRWNEAQSAYFDAFLFARRSNETAINPDYAYNLAVSLEQLNQPEAALEYYQQAQTLAREVTPGFDTQALSRRISFLEQNRP